MVTEDDRSEVCLHLFVSKQLLWIFEERSSCLISHSIYTVVYTSCDLPKNTVGLLDLHDIVNVLLNILKSWFCNEIITFVLVIY